MKKRLDLPTGSSSPAPSEPGINAYNGQPLSKRYYDILEKRKTLPVWEQREEFHKMFASNQIMILQGETGSGKTTQVRFLFLLLFFNSSLTCCETQVALEPKTDQFSAFAVPSHF